MKKIFGFLKNQRPEIRMLVAGILALSATALIAVGWMMSPSDTRKTASSSRAPSPINALGQSIRSSIQQNPVTGTWVPDRESSNTAQVQIVNVSDSFDESNPYEPISVSE